MRKALTAMLIAAGFVGALWFRFNAPPPGRGLLYPHDLLYSYYPKVDLIGSRLAQLELPLWNPFGCAGMPLLGAIQNAILYPPMWVSALLPAGSALGSLTWVHLLLAAWGAALLFRCWQAPPILAGALGGVFVFVCGLGQSFWPPQVFAIAWMPWMLLCIERAFGDPSAWRWWSGLVAVTALQLLAGFPQHVVYTLQIAAPLLLLRGVLFARASGGSAATAARAVGRVVLALGLGAGIAAVQLVPAAEFILESERRESVSPKDAQYLQSQPRLTTILANSVKAEPRITAFEIGEGVGYVGTGTLVLAAVAIVSLRRRPLVWGLLVLGGGFLLLSDGYVGIAHSVFEAYASLPLVGSFRSPERLLLLAGFSAVGLAALGASVLSASDKRDRPVAIGAAGVTAAAIALLGNTQAALAATATACVVAGAFFLHGAPRSRRALECLVALILLTDVVLATGAFGSLRAFPGAWAEVMHVGGHAVMNAEEVDAQRQRVADGRVAFHGRGMLVRPIAGAGPLREVRRLGCYETPVPEAWQDLSRLVKGGDYRSAIAVNVDPDRFAALLDLAGVVEVTEILGRPSRGLGARFAKNERPVERLARGMSVSIRPNRDALPRAYVVGAYEVTPDDTAIRRIAVGALDYRNSVLLDRAPELAEPRVDRMYPARIVSDEAERVEVASEAPAAGLLVLSDTYYPGWHASIDGEPAPILRANGLFRAVAVRAGEHRVVFEYMPKSLRIGAGISGMALLLTIWVSLRQRRAASRAAMPGSTSTLPPR